MKDTQQGLLLAATMLGFGITFVIVLPWYLNWVVVFPMLEMLLLVRASLGKNEG